ncbi:allergenic cerato-platanin asp f13 [Moniliophthora roreri MCA 2997]|uniref:Cerato-platanin 3 n=2 Tax=Moniliophthora roreri TaxID=221103 RepID=S4UQR3_MONRR|nr:cerato-platanin 3 [Moniliophthora roreri]ESK87458.1 allergenic cerato-platanin asp f13 [Moniliophthora roreri MCA 2997]KAI3616798.1 allergenic cerato-platanin asp f13 [Moniliophthora roreri]
MKFIAAVALLATSAAAVQLQYDPVYDNADQSFLTVACSDGSNGMIIKGYPTFGSVPSYVGAVDTITGWNSESCGTCYQITWSGTGKTIHVVGVDVAGNGFNVGQKAMDDLTNGQAVALGNIDVTATRVDKSVCGL